MRAAAPRLATPKAGASTDPRACVALAAAGRASVALATEHLVPPYPYRYFRYCVFLSMREGDAPTTEITCGGQRVRASERRNPNENARGTRKRARGKKGDEDEGKGRRHEACEHMMST